MAARGRAAPRQRGSAPAPIEAVVGIERLGASGDGVGRLPGGPTVYVAGALPGETVRIRIEARRGEGFAARLLAVESPSPERAVPPCPAFGRCGGCSAQHLADAAYAAWKLRILTEALLRGGIEVPPGLALRRTAPGERRRAEWALRREGARVRAGFHAARSPGIVEPGPCPVLDPSLARLPKLLEAALAPGRALRREGEALVNRTATGADLLLRLDGTLSMGEREGLARFAESADLARLSVELGGTPPEPLVVRRAPVLRFADVAVEPPPGAFLQASEAGEAAILEAVLAALAPLPDRASLLELHSGIGTLTFPASRRLRVTAFEGDAAAVTSLDRAARRAGIALAVERRDLVRRPPTSAELGVADALLLDPPRTGAAEAVRAAVAAERPKRIVYVSCSPASLARDGRMLLDGGWRLDSLVPIDQFLWSGHLEGVACFVR